MKTAAWTLVALLALSLSFAGCKTVGQGAWDLSLEDGVRPPARVSEALESLAATASASLTPLAVTRPFAGAVFPPDMAAPEIVWLDQDYRSEQWLVSLTFADGKGSVHALAEKSSWTPDVQLWERVKNRSVNLPVSVEVVGLDSFGQPVSLGGASFSTSSDPVSDLIMFRQVPLPFDEARNLDRHRWRIGDISAYSEPETVMRNLPVCASCHTVSRDGSLLSMEMNFNHDAGSQLITPVRERINLVEGDFLTWSDFPAGEDMPPTRGLFGRMSPDGKSVAASVNEVSFIRLVDDLYYSQVFFPVSGIIATYDRDSGRFSALPGADDRGLVQANPTWSADGSELFFARAVVNDTYPTKIKDDEYLVTETPRQMHERFPMRFDLYRIPFNGGKGGEAKPLKGAGGNGYSNYFARQSPDGKWIVFTRSVNGLMLTPDSELFIIPSEGGEARRMSCNLDEFNSWHSWSSNSRWLLFTSKANTPYTEIFLTHVDEEGNDSPPVLLGRFSHAEYAANVPEFIPRKAGVMKEIRLMKTVRE